MRRAVLLWTSALILSTLTIGVLNFFWMQGFAALTPEPHPLSPDNAGALQLFLNWFIPAFNAILLFFGLLFFHDQKKIGNLASLCAILVLLLAIITFAIVPNLIVGLWYPFLPPLPFFQL